MKVFMSDTPQQDTMQLGQAVVHQGRKVFLSDKTTCPVCKRQNLCPGHEYAFIDWYKGYMKRFISKGTAPK